MIWAIIAVISAIGVLLFIWAKHAETEGGRLPLLSDMAADYVEELYQEHPILLQDPDFATRAVGMKNMLIDKVMNVEAPLKSRGLGLIERSAYLRREAVLLDAIQSTPGNDVMMWEADMQHMIADFLRVRADALVKAHDLKS